MAGGARANAGAGSYPLICLPLSHSGMARKRQTRNLESRFAASHRPGMTLTDKEAS